MKKYILGAILVLSLAIVPFVSYGEVDSPRISGISGQIQSKIYPGANIKVSGRRLTKNIEIVKSSDHNIRFVPSASEVRINDGSTRLDFRLPTTTLVGGYYINVFSADPGVSPRLKSPTVGFRVLPLAVASSTGVNDPSIDEVVASTTNIYPGSWVKIRGQRLTKDVRIVKQYYPNIIIRPEVTLSADNRRIDFKLPTSVAPGAYYINVFAPNGRNSNTKPFSVAVPRSNPPVACAEDLYTCPGGQSVSRSGANCTFSCPDSDRSTITVVSPNGGESYVVGSSVEIKWKNTGIALDHNVQIALVDTRYSNTEDSDRSEATIAHSIPNTGTYVWKIPQNIGIMKIGETQSPIYRINVYSWSDAVTGVALGDSSDNVFSIKPDTSTWLPAINELSVSTTTGSWIKITGSRLTTNVKMINKATKVEYAPADNTARVTPYSTGGMRLDFRLKPDMPVGEYDLTVVGSNGKSNVPPVLLTVTSRSAKASSQIAAVVDAIRTLIGQLKAQ